MNQREVSQVVLDPRLTPAAVRVVLDVARRGDGEHEIPASHFRALLQAGEKVVRRELRLAEERRWIRRRVGGQGNNDFFTFTPAESAALIAQEQGVEDDYPGQNGRGKDITPAENGRSIPDTPVKSATLSLARDDGGDVCEINRRAAQAIEQHAELLSGCTGALRDYLAAHVQPKKQSGYVQMLATWLNGHGFNWKDAKGEAIPKEDRTGLIAAALNELDTQGEEQLKYDEGDPRNLRTKLGILSRPIERPRPAMTAADEQRHYTRQQNGAASRGSREAPRSLGSSKAPDPVGGDDAQKWAAEHPAAFARIKEEIAQAEGIDLEDGLQRLRLVGLAIKRVQEQLTA